MRLFREIQAKGYAYGASNVSRFVAQLRRDEAAERPVTTGSARKSLRVRSARSTAALFLHRPDDLEPDEQAYLERLVGTNAALEVAYRLTQDFALMVRERQGDRLDAWLTEAEGCEVSALRRFAKGLRDDLAAVRAGLREIWSNGPTEGFVNKLKRPGYGRAGFPVLRQRMLRAA